MAFLDFTDKLSVKITVIDEQHKELIAIINDLHAAMSAGKGRIAIYDVLARLIEYTKMHFATEARLMVQHSYPDRKNHETQHNELIRQVDELNLKVQGGQISVTIETMDFLKKWLNNHILLTDKQFGVFLAGKGVK
jgi:hemerythrin